MMDGQQFRGRSSSTGHQPNHIRHSPSPHQFQDHTSRLDLDPLLTTANFDPRAFSTDLISPTSTEPQYNLPHSFFEGSPRPTHFQPHVLPSNDFPDRELVQSFQQNGIEQNLEQRISQAKSQQPNHQYPSSLLVAGTPINFEEFDNRQKTSFENFSVVDPSLQTEIQQHQHQSINPADIMSNLSNVSSPQNLNLTPPNMMPSDPSSPLGQGPIGFDQGQHYSPNHSRHASLDPSSAQFLHGQQPADWTGVLSGAQFQGHRREPSEHSDVSSSVAPSPFQTLQESFDGFDQNPSPMLSAQPDQLYEDALGIGQFSLSDVQHQQQQRISPGHSPYASPRVSPQPEHGFSHENYMLSRHIPNNFNGTPGPDIYTDQSENAFPQFQARVGSADMGQAASMAPPEINVELAPPSRQTSFEPPRPDNDLDALSPPERGRRGRMRAKSDPYLSRVVSPNPTSPSLSSNDPDPRNRSLSPFDMSFSANVSRDPSPSSSRAGVRRSSTSSIPNRDYILELADPNRPPASGTDKRIQKHPATFQCTLCPKRFTRAYNLRSHLRTHTDERPFVCTVCGKAFARQHDRKRHEGLHSGEKKFVCRGDLGTGGSWGCGRRFARADALGRHFRSEAGRICIKPLLDEEAMERQRVFDEQMMNPNTHQQHLPPNNMSVNGNANGFTLPAALLAQYPALQGLQWDQLGPVGGVGDEGEVSGRGSFDASSGGEGYFDDEDGGGGYASGSAYGGGSGSGWGGADGGWEGSDYEGR